MNRFAVEINAFNLAKVRGSFTGLTTVAKERDFGLFDLGLFDMCFVVSPCGAHSINHRHVYKFT